MSISWMFNSGPERSSPVVGILIIDHNIRAQLSHDWFWTGQSDLCFSLNVVFDFFVHGFEFFFGGESRIDHSVSQAGDWVARLSNCLDFVPGSVTSAWIGHTMAVVSVGF